MGGAQTNLGCLGQLLGLLGFRIHPAATEQLPYRLRDDFLSPAELSFFRVLQLAIGDRWVISCKVNLTDLFFVPRGEGQLSWRNRIDRKHVDFVLCDPATMHPRLGIELDDSSHQREDRQDRDLFVNEVFDAAALRLLRIPAARTYSVSDIAAAIEGEVGQSAAIPPVPPSSKDPICPKCGIPMVQRKATRGANRGGSFWGCSNFPECREVIRG